MQEYDDCKKVILLESMLVNAHISINFLLIVQIPRGRNVFCEVRLNFIILFQSEILLPNSGEDKKKVFAFWF